MTAGAQSPRALGYRMPAEWGAHAGCYTAWPAHEYAWGSELAAAQAEFASFARAFAANGGQEPLWVLVDPEHEAQAARALAPDGQRLVLIPHSYGDVWLRDTGPLFVHGPRGRATLRFGFNGWGGKYIYPHDAELAQRLAARHADPQFNFAFVLEGGALEVDGEGTALTTRACLQNPNRGPVQDDARIEALLGEALGIERVLWLARGLANDHTDGHIDNIARFVAPGVVACMYAAEADDPNRATLEAIEQELRAARDARGRRLELVRVPAPGRVSDASGALLPASHLNFYLGNARVLLPVFGTRWDDAARAALQSVFASREVVPSPARALLTGGGTFHCMTQQVPEP